MGKPKEKCLITGDIYQEKYKEKMAPTWRFKQTSTFHVLRMAECFVQDNHIAVQWGLLFIDKMQDNNSMLR
jgi:hypothetical protein